MQSFLRILFAGLLASPFLSFAAQVKIGETLFTVADGFVLELVAGPPLVNRPIVADFDELGRLYVADSSGSNDKVEKQLQEKPHRIVRLEDTDGDGRYDKSVVFADRMMFPEGILYYDGAVYCGAPPTIWKLQDTDGNGVADKRTEWFKGETLTGCANDLHGPYLGPDGWIYWCKGAFAKQTHDRPGKGPVSDSAAHIFRSRPDGSLFDSVIGGGMDNPVEIAFTPEGEAIFTTTFYVNPEGGRRDALVHAVYGGAYPKIHGVIDPLKRTGELMPAMTHLGPAAPSGLCRYASQVFGKEFENNLFSSQFNMHRVQRHVLESVGSTFKTRDEDLVASDNPDFHPTDVLEDADGSLLILDTGGWYKLCCPTSQIAKPEVLGAIYRVRRKGALKINDPRGLKLDWARLPSEALVNLLGDSRPFVQKRAIEQLAKQQTNAIAALVTAVGKSRSPVLRRNALWTLTRMPGAEAREAIRRTITVQREGGDSAEDDSLRQIAAHAIGIWQDIDGMKILSSFLHRASPSVRRVAAEALGQIRAKTAVPELLAAAALDPDDRILQHSITFALIEIGDELSTRAGLSAAAIGTRRAALVALDQMANSTLKADEILPLLTSEVPALRESARWIASRHSEWGKELTGYFTQRLYASSTRPADHAELQRDLAQFARDPSIQSLIADELNASAAIPDRQQLLLKTIGQASIKEIPPDWTAAIEKGILSTDEETVRSALQAVRALPASKTNSSTLARALLAAGKNENLSRPLRLDALAAIPVSLDQEPALFQFVRGNIPADQPLTARNAAATIFSRGHLSDEQLALLAEQLEKVGPMELPRVLNAFAGSTDEKVGSRLTDHLEKSRGLASLQSDALRAATAKFPAAVRDRIELLAAGLNVDAPKQKARLDQLAQTLLDGDKARGHLVFNGAKAACASCHAIGYRGGQIGPDLTRVGAIRTERDLLESIIYPSASFVRSYEPVVVVTKDGETRSGLIKRETSDSMMVVSGPANEQQIARSEILEIHPGKVSVMPEGLDQQLQPRELADLIAFLKSLK